MQNLEWYLADLKSTGKNTMETVEKSLTDMFIRLVRIYPCLLCGRSTSIQVPEWYMQQVLLYNVLEIVCTDLFLLNPRCVNLRTAINKLQTRRENDLRAV